MTHILKKVSHIKLMDFHIKINRHKYNVYLKMNTTPSIYLILSVNLELLIDPPQLIDLPLDEIIHAYLVNKHCRDHSNNEDKCDDGHNNDRVDIDEIVIISACVLVRIGRNCLRRCCRGRSRV